MELHFAPATEEDIEALYACNRALIERYEDPNAIDREAVLAWVARKLRARIGQYRRILWDGQLAGWIRVDPTGEAVELDDLYILPELQNRGIGTAVLNRCLAEAAGPIFFYVFTRNTGAIRLYERLGFRAAETVSPTRIIMRWP